MSVQIIHGDSREQLPLLAADSIDAVITDPPYALVSITKRWSGDGPPPREGVYRRSTAGFMGKAWDTGETAFDPAFWSEVLRVMKPGAHLIAFGGTRTYHRLVCAIEDAGFEIRDQLAWLFGSGFPKSHDVSKAIDKAAGAERQVIGPAPYTRGRASQSYSETRRVSYDYDQQPITEAATPEAAQWQGWGSALKPAHEPIVLARKPLIGTIAANVLKHGTGALNIDACRVEGVVPEFTNKGQDRANCYSDGLHGSARTGAISTQGRWPANVIHDGSPEVLAGFPDGGAAAPVRGSEASSPTSNVYGETKRVPGAFHADSGSAARFFYTPKADKLDRLESKHPTVKPVDLMAYLIKLVTPPGGTVLDCFAGSGSTGMAAMREGFNAILIEREAEYVRDIQRRLDHVHGHDTPLFAEIAS